MSIRTYDKKHKKRANLEVKTRIEALQEALDAGRPWLSQRTVTHCEQRIASARTRIKLSLDHTVVVLAGTTGSGKSSLLNTMAGRDIAHVSAKRPTTSQPVAVVWDATESGQSEAADMVNWLGVRNHHVIDAPQQRKAAWPPWRPATSPVQEPPSATPRTAPHMLRSGLVLIDLPDMDSLQEEHRTVAQPIIDRADLIIWVTDPQKYADATLHNQLARLPHATETIVVLNHSDRLDPQDREGCLADLRRLVREHTHTRTRVMATSATTGLGVVDLASVVDLAAGRRAALAGTLNNQLRECGEMLLSDTPPSHTTGIPESTRETLVDSLSHAIGVNTICGAVRQSALRHSHAVSGWPLTAWISTLRKDPLRSLGVRPWRTQGERNVNEPPTVRGQALSSGPHAQARIDMAVRSFLETVTAPGPPRWQEQVHQAVDEDLSDALDGAISNTDVIALRPAPWWRGAVWVHKVFLMGLIIGMGWLSFLAVAAYLQLPVPNTPAWMGFPIPTVITVIGAAGGVVFALLCRAMSWVYAQGQARRVYRQLRSHVHAVTSVRVIEPVEALVESREQCSVAALIAAR
ncbi:GTPase family protein [Jonesia quinghaiensis]|uniref:GTPase family protein n=1 Tax=Jonesia quinghaiensis TaxID=262806 RepID=UPI0003F7F83F|nr:dynamin family protein [Jonesia quinghaiensis]